MWLANNYVFSNPINQSAARLWRLNLCSYNGISWSKHSLPSLHEVPAWQLVHALSSMRETIFVSLWIHLNGIIVGKSFVWSCLAAAFHGLRWGFCYGGGVNKTEISVVEIIHSKQPHTDELPCSRGHVVCVHHVCRASVCTCIRCLLVS